MADTNQSVQELCHVASFDTDCFPLTEAGDAEYFAAVNGDCVRFDHLQGRWLIFSGHRWTPDGDGQRYRLALETMRLRQVAALEIADPARRKEHSHWAMKGESRSRMENMLAIAKTLPPISDTGDDWDRDPWLLGVENGILDLRSGLLRSGKPEDRITMCVAAPYEPEATCVRWQKTLHDIFAGDQEVIDFVQRALGYSLTGDTREQCLFMNCGDGANGKSTLITTVFHVLGDYAADLPFSALELQERRGIPNDIAKLAGKRFVTSSETNDGTRLNEGRVKTLTGCDPMTARFLHREFFTFQPVAKFWLAMNHKPVVRDDTHGFWRRILLIPFTQRFSGARDNKSLREELKREAAGILCWLVEGCIYWQMGGLEAPQAVLSATAEYEAESNPLAGFLDERCVLGDKQSAPAQELYMAYLAWATDQPAGERSMNQKTFGQQIKKRFRVEERSHKVRYLGVDVRRS